MKKNPLNSVLAFSALTFMRFFPKKAKVTGKDLEKADFKASTGHIGVSFNEKIRENFRKKWIRLR